VGLSGERSAYYLLVMNSGIDALFAATGNGLNFSIKTFS